MEMKLTSPSKILLPSDDESVKRFLTFTDRQIQFQIKKLKDNMRWANYDPTGYKNALEELKVKLHPTLVFYDEAGQPWTYSGLWKELQERFGWNFTSNRFDEESARSIPWATIPHAMRDYQREAFDALCAAGHGAVSLPTGSGKSLILLNLCKKYPVKTIIATPSASITDQLYKDFQKYFGKKYVGKYGDGRKDSDKLFTVGVAQALTLIEENTEAYANLSKSQQFIFDESHTCPADTFEKVCMGIAANAPLRFFTSATQIRNDGSELVLKGITGPIVYKKDFRELVDAGWLKKPIFKCFNVSAYGDSRIDVKAETRKQLYENPNVNKLAAEIAQKAVTIGKRQTLIIIEEFKQFIALKNYLQIPFEFVHGGASSKEVKEILPQEYWKSNTEQAIKNFNEGRTQLLIGTSAISTGVDIRPTGCLIYLQGGTSEIKVKQAIGRGTRVVEGLPKDFWVVDFNIVGSPAMERHFAARKEFYDEMSDEVNIYG